MFFFLTCAIVSWCERYSASGVSLIQAAALFGQVGQCRILKQVGLKSKTQCEGATNEQAAACALSFDHLLV